MTDFRLSCCKLMETYPLYRCRRAREQGYALHVLLIGQGDGLDAMLREILANGQLLDTSLTVTVLNPDPNALYRAILRKAPYADHFLRFTIDDEWVNAPTERCLASVQLETAQLESDDVLNALIGHDDCPYILISTGDDSRNHRLAEACAELAADPGTLIACVQSSAPRLIRVLSPVEEVQQFGTSREDPYRRRLEQIAFNLHYAYTRENNERADRAQMRREFEDPYIYVSNMEAAVHIRSKLAAVGIETEDLSEAAGQFSRLLRQKPELLERLAAMEHDRWVVEKLMDGYRQVGDFNLLYSAPGITTRSSRDKWHCCLVSCDETGVSRLRSSDWKSPVPRPELDGLDKLTLQVHHKCGELANANRAAAGQLLQDVKTMLLSQYCYSRNTQECANRLELIISHLWQHKRSAIALYHRELRDLTDAVITEGGRHAALIRDALTRLNTALAPLLEHISRKDYKQQDRVLVERIPFALTHKPSPVMLKLLAEKETDNLFAPWQLEPEQLIYFAMASGELELMKIQEMASHIRRFLDGAGLTLEPVYHVFVPEALYARKTAGKKKRPVWNCVLHPATERNVPALADMLREILSTVTADYLDVTGGDPLLAKAAERYAEEAGIASFYVRGGEMLNLFRAEEVEYAAPVKSLTVREMFHLSGAVPETSQSSRLSDLSSHYLSLWEASRNTSRWKDFCDSISPAYKATSRPRFRFQELETFYPATLCRFRADPEAAAATIPMLRQLEAVQLLQDIRVESGGEIRFTLCAGYTSPYALMTFLQDCADSYRAPSAFLITGEGQNKRVELEDLYVRDMVFKEGLAEEGAAILQELAAKNVLTDYSHDPQTGAHSFRFASRDVYTCLQKTGDVLEYYVYYSALLDGHFDDVDMGWKFFHSSQSNSADNEIDVICTKGSTSLFLSAKMMTLKALKNDNKLNYTIYEICLLADRFGINARSLLAAPSVPQFQTDPETGLTDLGNDVKQALRRGVYLLGDACFQPGVLGQVLDRIAAGNENWCQFLAEKS